jgi:uncharacterized protein (DUF58 family)
MVAVVSDFLLEGSWERSMRVLRTGHDVLAFELVDPRELELPAVGVLGLRDPETGRRVEIQTSSRGLRERFAKLAAQQRAEIAASLRRAGADHIVLRTDRDWVVDVARYIANRRSMVAAFDPGLTTA